MNNNTSIDQERDRFVFFASLPEEKRRRIVRSWRTVVLAAYFIGIMKNFQNNVKIFGAIRQCDHMEQIEEQKMEEYAIKRRWYIFYPNDKYKSIWNIILVVLLILTGIITPFRVCFVRVY